MDATRYIVQPSDTLIGIAEREAGTPSYWQEIAKFNGMQYPYPLFAGQPLSIPHKFDVLSDNAKGYKRDSNGYQTASMALARGFLFVIVDVLPDVGGKKLVRKVIVIPHDFSKFHQSFPEKYGIIPNEINGKISLAEHAMGNTVNSQFTSASSKPYGAANFQGRPVLLDINKIKKTPGAFIHPVDAVLADLQRIEQQNPSDLNLKRLIRAVRLEGETLIEGSASYRVVSKITPAHKAYILKGENIFIKYKNNQPLLENELDTLLSSYGKSRNFGIALKGLTVIGVVFTVKDLTVATNKSMAENSFKPIGAEVLRQTAGWASAIAGAKIGAVAGSAMGIETGPGAIVTGAIGALIFGVLGYFGVDLIADQISPN